MSQLKPILALLFLPGMAIAQDKVLRISTPMSPPAWALLEREVLKASAEACGEFYRKYFDERGWLKCVERWGGDDGPATSWAPGATRGSRRWRGRGKA